MFHHTGEESELSKEVTQQVGGRVRGTRTQEPF